MTSLGRVQCIGDSLTYGWGGSPGTGGYRRALGNDLTAKSVQHVFVGTLVTWPGGSWMDGMHDGHGGWSTSDILNGRDGNPGVTGWLAAMTPDTIILMSGRNDPYDWSYSYDRYSSLIDTIYSVCPNVVVYWSNVFLPRDQSYWEVYHCEVQDAAIKQVIGEQRLLGRKLWRMDPYHALQGRTDIFSDTVHLNDLGYSLLEKVFFKSIMKTLAPNGGPVQVFPR